MYIGYNVMESFCGCGDINPLSYGSRVVPDPVLLSNYTKSMEKRRDMAYIQLMGKYLVKGGLKDE